MWTRQHAEQVLHKHRQQHALRFYDQLSAEGQQQLLLQLAAVDFQWLRSASTEPVAHAGPITPYEHVIRDDDAGCSSAVAVGESALCDGRVGTLLVAGGQGTRLGFAGPKGAFPLGAVSGRTLFQMHVQRLLALGQRYGTIPPLYLMTSPANHEQTRRIFGEHDNYGLPDDRLVIFAQGVAPAVDEQGKLLLRSPNSLVLAPNGNGGLFAAMRDGGAFAHMRQCGVDTISYIQVDNPLSRSCDPRFVGYHLQHQSEFSCKAIAKTDPHEKVGNYACVNGRLSIVEYTEIPAELATDRDADGRLLYGYGNPGLFLWSRAFAEAQAKRHDLPVHRAHKRIPYVDDRGQLVKPDQPNGYKLEMFALDTLPDAARVLVLECRRQQEFAPVKNAEGQDSPHSARQMMTALYSQWIRQAGGRIAQDIEVEINPLFALDADELARKVGPDYHVDEACYLE